MSTSPAAEMKDALEAANEACQALGVPMAQRDQILGSLIVFHGLTKLAEAVLQLGESSRSDHPLMGETFAGLAQSLDGVADAIREARQ